jgi:general secretion pathway protein G
MTKSRRRGHERGFTLIELLVVMAILGMLAALVGPNIFRQSEKARVNSAKVQMSQIATALDAFALDVGRYPSSSEGLESLMSAPSGVDRWDGPYLKKGVPKDPWGKEYEYRGPSSGDDYEILCYGADGRAGGEGGDADISTKD